MIGNNACGAHALAYGRTADNVLELDVMDGTGRRFTPGAALARCPAWTPWSRRTWSCCAPSSAGCAARSPATRWSTCSRSGADLAKALAGTEGTVVTVLGATVRLVPVPPAYALAVLGYPDVATAADAVPAVLAHAAARPGGPGRPAGRRGAPPQGPGPGARAARR